MKSLCNELTRPYAVIHFRKSNREKCMYCVFSKEGTDVPGFLGQGINEYIFLGFDLQTEEGEMELTIYTTNPNVIMAKPTEELYQGKVKMRITSFHLSPEHRAYGTYGNDAMLIEVSENLNHLTIRFYANLGSYAYNLCMVWNHGLLEDRVTNI